MSDPRDEWRWTDDQGVQRLVRTDELREALASQVLPPSVLVWREGMAGWVEASTVPELMQQKRPTPPPPPLIREPRFGGTIPDGAPAQGPVHGHAQAGTQDKRAPMPTLLGIAGPPSRDPARIAAQAAHGTQGAPIAVPSATSPDTPSGRSPITLPPNFSGAAFDSAAATVPRAPATPAEQAKPEAKHATPQAPTAEIPKPPPVRPAATSNIDQLWAQTDEDATNVTDRGPLLAAAAAKQAAEKSAQTPSPAQAKPALVTPKAEGPLKPAVVALPKQTPEAPPTQASPERTMTTTTAAALKTSLGLGPKPGAGPKPNESSTIGPSPAKILPKVAPKAPAETSSRAIRPPPVKTDALPKSSLDKPSSISRPLGPAAPRPLGVPRTPVPPAPEAAPRTKASPSTVPPPPLSETETKPHATEAAQAPAPAPEAAPANATAPAGEASVSLSQALPPPPPPREPSSTAILPLHVPAAPVIVHEARETRETRETRKPHEVSTTVRIQGLLSDEANPLPKDFSLHGPTAAAPTQASARGQTLPSDAGKEYPPLSELIPNRPPPEQATSEAPNEAAMMESKRARLAATVQGQRIAPEHPSASAASSSSSSVPIRALMASGGMLILMVIGSFFVGRCSVRSKGAPPLAYAGLKGKAIEARAALPAPPKPCWVAKQPVRWAPVVSQKIPFELLPMPSGNVSLGYAKSSEEAVGLEITPSSGQVEEVFADKPSKGELERVSPTGIDKGFFLATNEPPGALKSVIQVPGPRPFFLGLADGNIAYADAADAAPSPLWPLAAESLDAARAIAANEQGFALTFRKDNAIWGGWISADRKPVGELVKLDGSGASVGKPLLGYNGREIALVFADRADESSPWKMRFGHAAAGTIPATTEIIEMPSGGPGGDVFAPGLTGLPDGRWLLVWTEGSSGSRAIRVQTLSPSFTPVGDPIALSPPAGNFGQGLLSVAGSYVTAVFLQKGKSSYELWGGVLQCG